MSVDPKLNGKDIRRLRDALVSAFPNRSDLDQMVRVHLDTRLGAIVREGDLRAVAFELIQWAEAHGRVRDLLRGARKENPGNPALLEFERSLAARSSLDGERGEAPKVINFLVHYRGTADDPAIFVGREADVSALDLWLGDSSSTPYLLLEARPGMGKSSLLTQWVERHRNRAGLELLFFPVSLRFQTHREVDLFGYMLPRLGHAVPPMAAGTQRDAFLAALQAPPLPGVTRLVVIDGIDEACGWTADAVLFPASPPERLRVVVSARARTDRSWRDLLGWSSPALATVRTLAPLQEGEIVATAAAALRSFKIVADEGSLRRLYAQSEGDPFVLWLLLLEAKSTAGASLRAAGPREIRGLKGYLDRWLEEQRALWKEEGNEHLLPDLGALLHLLAHASGPLTSDDLSELRATVDVPRPGAVRAGLKALQRLVVESEGGGYSLSHVRLNWHIRDEELTLAENRKVARCFRDWARKVLEETSRGDRPAERVPPYLLLYAPDHLEASSAGREVWDLFLGGPWRDAWSAAGDELDLGYQQFVLDLMKRTPPCPTNASADPWGTFALRCALLVSCVASSHGTLPSDLLVASVERGLVPIDEALRFVRRYHRSDAWGGLTSATCDAEQERVLAAIREIRSPDLRARALADTLQHLPASQRVHVARESLTALPARPTEESDGTSGVLAGGALEQIALHGDAELLTELLERLPLEGYPDMTTSVLHKVAGRSLVPRSAFDGVLARVAAPHRLLCEAALCALDRAAVTREVVVWLQQGVANRRSDTGRRVYAFVREHLEEGQRELLDLQMKEEPWQVDEPQIYSQEQMNAMPSWGLHDTPSDPSAAGWMPPAPPAWRELDADALREQLLAQRQIGDRAVLGDVLERAEGLIGDETRNAVYALSGQRPKDDVSGAPSTVGGENEAMSPGEERSALLRGNFERLGLWELSAVVARHAVSLSEEQRWCLLGAARAHHLPEAFVEVATGIVRTLPAEDRRRVSRDAMRRVLEIEPSGAPGSEQVAALYMLSEVLDDDLVPEAMEIAEQLNWGAHSNWLQARLARRLPESQRGPHVARLLGRFYLPGSYGSSSELTADMIAELAALLSQEQMWEALRRIEPRSDFMGSSTSTPSQGK